MPAKQKVKKPATAHDCMPGDPVANGVLKELPTPLADAIATYQGASDWGKFGALHLFTLARDFPNHLVSGTTVTDKIVRELGGEIIDLDKLKKGDMIFTK